MSALSICQKTSLSKMMDHDLIKNIFRSFRNERRNCLSTERLKPDYLCE